MIQSVGLTTQEAEKRHQEFGANEIGSSGIASGLTELKELLLDPLGLMLLSLGVLYLLIGDKTDAIVLFVAYIPVTAVNLILNLRSRKALKALQSTLQLTAKVMRDNVPKEISIKKIVCGDVLVFEEGQSIPADGTIIEAHDLKINEAALTGESIPVEKFSQHTFYGGTIVLQGRGYGLVEQIGKATKFGKVATLLEETKSETSPLQKKVNHLIGRVVFLAIGLAIVLFAVEYFRSKQIINSLIVALTFGMAAVPEEFPLVFTLYLSLGAWRLSRHGVLVKSLPSVETLGSVDVICTDKTGTLTEGLFQLEELRPTTSIEIKKLWEFAFMACEKLPIDSMETAIFKKGNFAPERLEGWDLTWDYSFESVGKHMSHVWKNSNNNQTIIAMKGSVEGVLEHCNTSPDDRKKITTSVDEIAGLGKRILGLAYREGTCIGDRTQDERDLIFAGLLIFSDPIRSTVQKAIASCQAAGIKIKMLTGDHPFTAHAVADQTGIVHEHEYLFTGDQLSKMGKAERWTAYQNGSIFSRVLPEQKYEMVQSLKETGSVVAMTGDGINDAPALKIADIGISMGLNATDVARSSAKMILLKNDFNGIVEAVFEGRRIFANLKRSFSYLVAFHIPVILLALIPPILGWGDLLLPIHIVLLELVVHPVSAFAFENLSGGTGFREHGLMPISRFLEATLAGTLLSLGCLALFYSTSKSSNIDTARAIAFITVLLGNIGFVLTETFPHFTKRTFGTILGLCTLVASLAWITEAAHIFHLGTIDPKQLIVAGLVATASTIPTFLIRQRNRT